MRFDPSLLWKGKLVLLDCASSNWAEVSEFPAWIGGRGANLEVDESDVALVEFEMDGKTMVVKSLTNLPAQLNGIPPEEHNGFVAGKDYTLRVGSHLVLFCITKQPSQWAKARTVDSWRIANKGGAVMAGPAPLQMLRDMAPRIMELEPQAIVHQVTCASGFYLKDAADALGWDVMPERYAPVATTPKAPTARAVQAPAQPAIEINTDSGEFTCPACWQRFDRGEVLHISAHASLKGDPILGEEEMLRFSATRFNNSGQAIDAMGISVTEVACPHCRRKLPPSFLDLPQHILSIVGAPSSGKSYFLSVLVKMLQSSLFTHFNAAFYDGDPAENIRLTEMKNKLFSASTPDEAKLAKTQLEGDMYVELRVKGHRVRMPKPFIFNVAPQANRDEALSVVFYDNAGEHFEPSADNIKSPGAQHVAAASGIFFLFDPTYNLEFRKRLAGHHDPQVTDQRFDQQDTILAEMNARIKRIRGLDFRDRIDTPLAFVVGKSDVWDGLIGDEPFGDPLWDTVLDLDLVERNSSRLRSLLSTVAPAVVANAEAISNNVRYFPVSAFGCSPEQTGIDPQSKRPIFSP
ncbi:MAG: hypothetical protein ACOVMP_09670, partial [Chthoniobacterales bacterium]